LVKKTKTGCQNQDFATSKKQILLMFLLCIFLQHFSHEPPKKGTKSASRHINEPGSADVHNAYVSTHTDSHSTRYVYVTPPPIANQILLIFAWDGVRRRGAIDDRVMWEDVLAGRITLATHVCVVVVGEVFLKVTLPALLMGLSVYLTAGFFNF